MIHVWDQKVSADAIVYYVKIEHDRTYKGFDIEVKENQPYRARIAKLENDLRKMDRGELGGSIKSVQKELELIKSRVPHRLEGKMIEHGIKKPGLQTHIHVIVSRTDVTNRSSQSQGSKYMESESKLKGR